MPSRALGNTASFVITVEFHFDQLAGLARRSLPSPLSNGIRCRLRQNRMAAFYIYRLNPAFGRNDGLDLDHSLQRHTARQSWISWSCPGYKHALTRRVWLDL